MSRIDPGSANLGSMTIQTKIGAQDAYHADFTAWLLEQADRLRARDADALDWENLADEIESLGLNNHRELTSRLRVIMIHCLKLMLSRDDRPRAGWRVTIMTQRDELAGLLAQSPSLRRRVPELAVDLFDKSRKRALADLSGHEPDRIADYRNAARALSPIDADRLLDDEWFPDPPAQR